MQVTVDIESPLQDDVRTLVTALNEHLLPLSPREFQFGISVSEMADPRTTVFVARDGSGRAVGCGALTVRDDAVGEVKRMFTVPEARGARVAARTLDAIIERARELGLERVDAGGRRRLGVRERSPPVRAGRVPLPRPLSRLSGQRLVAFFELRLS